MTVMPYNNTAFKNIREFFGYNQTTWAKILETQQATIAMIEANKRGVPPSIREKFLETYHFTYEEAIKCETKEELQKLVDKQKFLEVYSQVKQRLQQPNADLYSGIITTHNCNVLIPFYSAKAAAGKGEMLPEYTEENTMSFDIRWLKNILGVSPNTCVLISATGDSMLPLINDGDLLLIDTSVKDVINNKVFVIQEGSDLRVKRLKQEFNGDIYLISENEKYPPELVNTPIEIIGRVVWNGSKDNI